MRKIFTLLTLCLLATAAWAQTEIVFTPGETVGTQESVSTNDEMNKDGVVISTTYGAFKTAQYRFGKNAVTTFTSSAGNITKIQFTCTSTNPANGFGDNAGLTFDGNDGTWTGNAAEVVLTTYTKQVRATKIVVTVEGGGLAKPTIKPAAGTYYSPIQVTITCGTSGANIHYTTDGSTPTTNSPKYTAPFTLSTSTTVKAISAKDGDVSDVVEATYEFQNATPVANIAEFQNAADETVVVFTSPVNVLVQSGNRMFVQDNTGRALFFGTTGQTYKNGDVIPAGFVGTKITYDGEPELKDLANFQAASGNSPIAPEPITTTQVEASRFAQYVSLAEVTFDKTNRLVVDAAGNAPYYCNMNVKEADIAEDTEYDIKAIVGSYGRENTVYQLLPVEIKKHGVPIPGFGWGSMAETADNAEVTFSYESTVVAISGKYMYAMDETGYGLAYGDRAGKTYTPGDVIPAGFGGKKITYKDEPELAETHTGFEAASKHLEKDQLHALAKEISLTQVGHDTWAWYVLLKQVYIDTQKSVFRDANGNEVPYYNSTFNCAFPSDLTKPYDIYAVVAKHNNYQLLPLEVDVEIPEVDINCIEDLYGLSVGQVGHFLKPLTTIYQNGNNLYVKDECGAYSLAFGSTAYQDFVNGDFINDAKATWTEYQSNKQMVPVTDTFVKSGHGAKVEPEMMPIEEVSQDMIHWYLRFENVTLAEAEAANTYTMTDETGEMLVYHKFNQTVVIPNLDPNKTYTVEGFLTIYKGQLELYPILVDDGSGLKGDVNGDGEVNIADINAAIDMILIGDQSANGDVNGDGEVNIADINAIIDIILNS